MQKKARLQIKIDHVNPIDLIKLSESFLAFSRYYARFIKAPPSEDAKFYIEEVTGGSAVLKLVAKCSGKIIDPVGSFVFDLAEKILVLKSEKKLDKEGIKTMQEDLKDIKRILHSLEVGNIFHITTRDLSPVVIDSNDATICINNIDKHLKSIEETKKTEFENYYQQIFQWRQIRNEEDASKIDVGIIKLISHKEISVQFFNLHMKKQILRENMCLKKYIVDVKVESKEGVPIKYTILRVHDPKKVNQKTLDIK